MGHPLHSDQNKLACGVCAGTTDGGSASIRVPDCFAYTRMHLYHMRLRRGTWFTFTSSPCMLYEVCSYQLICSFPVWQEGCLCRRMTCTEPTPQAYSEKRQPFRARHVAAVCTCPACGTHLSAAQRKCLPQLLMSNLFQCPHLPHLPKTYREMLASVGKHCRPSSVGLACRERVHQLICRRSLRRAVARAGNHHCMHGLCMWIRILRAYLGQRALTGQCESVYAYFTWFNVCNQGLCVKSSVNIVC